MATIATNHSILIRRAWWYTSLQGQRGIDRKDLERLLGDHGQPVVEAMLEDRFLYQLDGGERVRCGRSLPSRLQDRSTTVLG